MLNAKMRKVYSYADINFLSVDEMAQRLDELEASIKAGADTND